MSPAQPGLAQACHPALAGLAFTFREEMAGAVTVGATDPRAGAPQGAPIAFSVRIDVDDLDRFIRVMDHEARLEGTVTFAPLGGTFPIRGGRFNLFRVDGATGQRRMTYAFQFTAADGRTYALRGHKDLHDDPGFDAVADLTTLFTTLHAGEDEGASVYAAGILRFALKDLPALVASMTIPGPHAWWQGLEARLAFGSFAWGALRDEYLRGARLLYDTGYENVVLSGAVRGVDGAAARFFLVAGVHERGFPWGDDELFSDVLLAVSDGAGGWERYAVSDRVLDGLQVDVARGTCRYAGPAFRLAGPSVSSSAMRRGDPGLVPCTLTLELAFDARPLDAVNVAFPLVPRAVRRLRSALARELRAHLPGSHPLGITITPHEVTVRSGSIRVAPTAPGAAPRAWTLDAGATYGEAERGTFRNVKEPTLLYGYLCALRPAARAARVQIHARTLRDEKEHWAKDRLDAFLGAVVSRTSASELRVEGGALTVSPLAPAGRPAERAPLLRKVAAPPVIEVLNDHFPTAVFIRRVVEVDDPSGERCLALEEDMSRVNLAPIPGPDGVVRRATVASHGGDDPLATLDGVLDDAGFDALAEARLAASGKARRDFLVVIKPNFMFSYDRADPSTYTDPALVHRLVARLRARGFENVKVVEAQSTYGEYFERRSVAEVGRYLGYDGSAGYELVDLTLDRAEQRDLGPHLGVHPVPLTWRDADLRVSFAKNKTHCYAYYSLTLKNVYGALALPDKFREYHCGRGIYRTTIEYLAAYPVHFGLVDAWCSADGPFGVFADPRPAETRAILGGTDLVAVDWVAATRMGIEPRLSPYLRLAVEAFGKPAIDLVGEATPYRPWLNVPVALALFTNHGLDASYHFGNVFYVSCAQMDERAFPAKRQGPVVRLLRRLTTPLRRAFFVRTGEDPSLANRFFSALFYWMGF
jgi:cholesterol oxidase